MVETKSGVILGHTGLDDNYSEDGVSLIFSKDKFEDEVFKGMFVIIENDKDKSNFAGKSGKKEVLL